MQFRRCMCRSNIGVKNGHAMRMAMAFANTLEGGWTSVRNFLRPFRGVHKAYLAHYLALCEWTLLHKQLRPLHLARFVRVHDSYT